jgi:hypothetical protein
VPPSGATNGDREVGLALNRESRDLPLEKLDDIAKEVLGGLLA